MLCASDLHLLPEPVSLETSAGQLSFGSSARLGIRGTGRGPSPAVLALVASLERCGIAADLGGSEEAHTLSLEIDAELFQRVGSHEAYRLEIAPDGIQIRASGPAGIAYGVHTLRQIVEACAAQPTPGSAREPVFLPALVIDDAPGFRLRGATLDVSRDRVPTMACLFETVDLLASLKYNQLQLYTEHTFAYATHPEVWEGCDPLTAGEVRRLDAYCSERFIELVPNQQSFGHMHRWLTHPRLRHLAECPDGVEHPFSREVEPYGLCPVDPESLEFLASLYDELLPNFSSTTVNVGCDETQDLGEGRTGKECRRLGVGRVYLDFLGALNALLFERGKRMQFWADIVLNYPELVGELPARLKGATALLWGYEADHPFEEQARALADSGLPFCICPGTSSWQSIAGRFDNMMRNLECAAHHAQANGALGLLVTDWGDRGHLQPLPASYPGWLVGADLAWKPAAAADRRSPESVARLLSLHALDDPDGVCGAALVQLARAGERTGTRVPNASPLSLLITKADESFPPAELEDLQPAGLRAALDEVDTALEMLARETPDTDQHACVVRELAWCGGLLRFTCHLGLARSAGPQDGLLGDLAAEARAELSSELAPLIAEHRAIWALRSRPGGLGASVAWLERVAAGLIGPAVSEPTASGSISPPA